MEPVSPDARRRVRELRRELAQAAADSRARLNRALVVAWRIGQLLRAEKPRVLRQMGRDAWPAWLAANFPDSRRAAERCMNLARSFPDERGLCALSLRQAYFRLGIATEPKRRGSPRRITSPLPGYVHSAQRLLISVRTRLRVHPGDDHLRRRLRQDLGPLHRQLDALFADAD